MKFELAWPGLFRIISGGQTGADQGGLLAGWRMNVETGGTAPLGYRVDGGYNELLAILGLTEAGDYATRTKKNIADSDGTVLFTHDAQSPGSQLTIKACQAQQKPWINVDISRAIGAQRLGQADGTSTVVEEIMNYGLMVENFVRENSIRILNVAGNRELRPSTTNGATRVITTIVEGAVCVALELLKADGKLIEKNVEA